MRSPAQQVAFAVNGRKVEIHVDTVRRLAEEHTTRARGVLANLPYSAYRHALDGIITEIEERRL